MAPVTRIQIAHHVSEAFGSAGASTVTKSELLSSAEHSNAPQPVLEQLGRLPEREFAQLRDLWRFLGEVPVD